jgi:hypothetical protein
MPYRQEAEVVIARWREVERELAAVDPTSEAATVLTDEWARLRAEHRRLIDMARLQLRPEPDAWPDPSEHSQDTVEVERT